MIPKVVEFVFSAVALALGAPGATVGTSSQTAPDTRNWTAADDHRHMMEQLGIKALRPGPSVDPKAPDHANYDEAAANPFPDYPELFKLNGTRPVSLDGRQLP